MNNGKDSLFQAINADISSGKLKVGDRIPSERQLASQYGITIRGVKSTLEKFVVNGVLAREQGRGTFVLRLPESLQQKSVGLLNLTASWAEQNLLFTELYRSIVQSLREMDYRIVHFPIYQDDTHMMDDIINSSLDGLILVSIPDPELVYRIEEAGLHPICIYFYPDMNPLSYHGYGVYVDHYNTMLYAIRWLKSLGHERITYLGSWSSFPPPSLQMNRFISTRSFISAVQANSIEDTIEMIDLNIPDKEEVIHRILSSPNPPTAILTDGPDFLPSVMNTVKDLHIEIPKDLSLLTLGWPQQELSGLYTDPAEMIDASMYLLKCQIECVQPFSRLIGLPERLNHQKTIAEARR